METIVVHRSKTEEEYVYIGRGSLFGNPFIIGIDGNRNEVIEKYKDYFYDRIKSDSAFKESVLKLKNKRLGCYCKPKACHGDIIKEYLDEEKTNG